MVDTILVRHGSVVTVWECSVGHGWVGATDVRVRLDDTLELGDANKLRICGTLQLCGRLRHPFRPTLDSFRLVLLFLPFVQEQVMAVRIRSDIVIIIVTGRMGRGTVCRGNDAGLRGHAIRLLLRQGVFFATMLNRGAQMNERFVTLGRGLLGDGTQFDELAAFVDECRMLELDL